MDTKGISGVQEQAVCVRGLHSISQWVHPCLELGDDIRHHTVSRTHRVVVVGCCGGGCCEVVALWGWAVALLGNLMLTESVGLRCALRD